MDKKTIIQQMYLMVKEDCNNDTETCLDFLKFLHEEKNELIYLKDMPNLLQVEKDFIKKTLNEE